MRRSRPGRGLTRDPWRQSPVRAARFPHHEMRVAAFALRIEIAPAGLLQYDGPAEGEVGRAPVAEPAAPGLDVALLGDAEFAPALRDVIAVALPRGIERARVDQAPARVNKLRRWSDPRDGGQSRFRASSSVRRGRSTSLANSSDLLPYRARTRPADSRTSG